MDPLTLALVGAGILGALSIKRATAPPPQAAPEAPQEAPGLTLGGFPPPAFGSGRGLRPAVTHREVSKERNIEGSAEHERAPGEEPAKVAPIGVSFSARAQEAVASGGFGDVAGGGGRVSALSPSAGGYGYVGASHPSTYPTFGLVRGAGGPTTRYR